MKRTLLALSILALGATACRAPEPWPHHCRACGKHVQVGKPKDPAYKPLCAQCWCAGRS